VEKKKKLKKAKQKYLLQDEEDLAMQQAKYGMKPMKELEILREKGQSKNPVLKTKKKEDKKQVVKETEKTKEKEKEKQRDNQEKEVNKKSKDTDLGTACFFCGQKGHLFKDCPNRSSKVMEGSDISFSQAKN